MNECHGDSLQVAQVSFASNLNDPCHLLTPLGDSSVLQPFQWRLILMVHSGNFAAMEMTLIDRCIDYKRWF